MACTKRIVDLQQYEGSTIVCEFALQDENGNQVDTTGITFTFTGKTDADDSDTEASWQRIIAGNGLDTVDCSVNSTGLDVGTYRYDIIAEQNGQREVYENASLIINQTVTD